VQVADIAGNFSHNLSTENLCTGTYFIEAADQTFSSLYANATFAINFTEPNSSWLIRGELPV